MARTGGSSIPDLMAGNHVVTPRATIQNRKEGNTMLKHLINVQKIRLAVFAVAMAILAISVPAGAKDKPLNEKEIKNLIANAETKAEHERIAHYFDAEAARYEAESKEHGELAQLYQRNTSATPTKYPGGAQSFQHCDSLSKSLQTAAEDARQLAAEHRGMAKEAKK